MKKGQGDGSNPQDANQREGLRSVNSACSDDDGNGPRHKFKTVPVRPHKFGKCE
jgi:hypothetical protein